MFDSFTSLVFGTLGGAVFGGLLGGIIGSVVGALVGLAAYEVVKRTLISKRPTHVVKL
jgi:uncharacterized membrane protein